MSRIIEQIEVDVPVRVAYDQWTQFESFPQFMEGIDRVVQLDDTTLEWTARSPARRSTGGPRSSSSSRTRSSSWRATEGAQNDGAIRFEPLGPDKTRITLQLDVEPEGLIEKAGDALGVVERRVKGDLERFREFIEGRGQATGAWRGQVEGGVVEVDDDSATDPQADLTGTGTGAGMRS